MKKPQKGQKTAFMERRLLIAIVASAVFAGVFVGLMMIGHHG